MSNQTESLAENFLQLASQQYPNIDAIRVLRARAYKIGDVHVLIRAASLGTNKRYFFGLNYINAEEVANLDNAFFVFICASIDQVVILPAPVFIQCLPEISHDRNGEYKIVIDGDLNLRLNGRGNFLDCSKFINAWHFFTAPPKIMGETSSAEESIHAVIQGRLLEIGNIRGYQTFCPNRSKKFNNKPLGEISTLRTCPELQYCEYEVLRQIDVIWFNKRGKNYIPVSAFEVELSTGTWSGVGRMATLIDYSTTNFYVISNDLRKFEQVMNVYVDIQDRYRHIKTELLGDLYAAEKNLKELRFEIGL